LEPRDSTYHALLGRYFLIGNQDPELAVAHFQRATELNPYDSSYWLDLALVYYDTGAKSNQQEAILRAIASDPTSPSVAWNAANFFLVQGDVTHALPQFAVVLQHDPSMVTPALDLCWRSLHDLGAIQAIIPPDPDVYLQFIKLMGAKGESEAAYHVWSELLRVNPQFDYRQALFYVDHLLEKGDVARARLVWEQLIARSPALHEYTATDNLVVDGAFSEDILNAGFDWRYSARSGVSVSLDSNQFHVGNRSLMLSYNDAGDDAGIFEYVPVEPNKRYALSAWVKSEELATANGPFLSVTDVFDHTTYATTEETIGTTVWHRVGREFQTGPGAKLVTIHFARDPGNTLIRGRFWVQEVSLLPTAQPAAIQ
jgi:tetratricopeptide (TPR) repeat protein